VKFGVAEEHVGPLGRAKFHANRCTGWERGPEFENFHFLVESPRGANREPFDRFLQLLGAGVADPENKQYNTIQQKCHSAHAVLQ